MEIIFDMPDDVYAQNEHDIEKIINHANEDLGQINNKIQCYNRKEDMDWAECWLEGTDGVLVNDTEILKNIQKKIHDKIYYGEQWHLVSGSFVEMELVVKENKDLYFCHACVKHGTQDESGSTTYKEYVDPILKKEDMQFLKKEEYEKYGIDT